MIHEYIQVSTTGADREMLVSIAARLVESNLAACCQIEGPIESIYRWKDVVETASEFRLLVKTRHSLYDDVERLILTGHSYDQPQITAVPIVECERGYANWLAVNTRDGGKDC
jgi:periplasmic divalent cation tolerance protein